MKLSDPTCYSLNGKALGDIIAAAPIVKYAIETFHQHTPYKVVAHAPFRDLLSFVPDENFLPLKGDWKFDQPYVIYCLNDLGKKGPFARLTPSRINLSQYAAINLLCRNLPKEATYYIPLKPVDVRRYGIDFSKAVIFAVSYRDETRSWPNAELLKTAEYVASQNYIPVFVGKTSENDVDWKSITVQSPVVAPMYAIDLRDKTSILELASIMAQAKAVVGIDSGSIHLAGTTKTPIVCGYTTVRPEYRIPPRKEGKTYAIIADDLDCNFCQSEWNISHWDFNKCKLGHADCIKRMTADRFIKCLQKIL